MYLSHFSLLVIAIIYDATPRQGDLFVAVTRVITEDSNTRTAQAMHVLFYVSTIQGSLNAVSLSAEISKALTDWQIINRNVPIAAMDRCFTNRSSANEMNAVASDAGEIKRFTVYCFSHIICNAGDKAKSILMQYFWSLLQKVFALSDIAKEEFLDVTGLTFPTYSETRWFSMYDVLEKISLFFSDLLTVLTRLTRKKYHLKTHPNSSTYFWIH